MKGIQPRPGTARWIDVMLQQMFGDIGSTQEASACQGFCERLRFVLKATLVVPQNYPRLPGTFTSKQRLKTREVTVQQALNRITKQRIVRRLVRLHLFLVNQFACRSNVPIEPRAAAT
jgi:hypothetical protein